jgi:hypothetical protein
VSTLGRGTIAWILTLPLWVAWPLPLVFRSEVLARSDTEAAIHIWGLWAAGVARHPIIVDTVQMGFPDGLVGVLVDPINLPAFLLGLLSGIPAAYNMLLYTGLVISGLAGALLAQRAGGWPALGATVAAASPPLLAQAGLGMTETFSVGIVGLTLYALLRALEQSSWGWRFAAGLGLGASWYAGPYNGIWSSLVCTVVGAAALFGARSSRAALGKTAVSLGSIGATGLALAAPVAWAVLNLRQAGQPGTGAAAGLHPPQANPHMFRGGLRDGADLTDPFLPEILTGGEALASHTAYLGAAALLMAGLAVWRRRHLWPWLAGALCMALIALGPWLLVGGVPVQGADGGRLMTPLGWLVIAVPFLGRLTHWYRAAAVGVLLLAVPVSTLARSWRGASAIGAIVLLDLALCAPMAWPLVSTPVPDASVFDALQGSGAMLTLPSSTTDRPNLGYWRDRIQLDQVRHGRPVAGVASWGGQLAPAGAHAQMLVEGVAEHGRLERAEQAAFAGSGFRWLVVYHKVLPHDPRRRVRLERCLGAPIGEDRQVWIFSLEQLRPEGCL